ncbi:MAG: RND transporter [Gammaproteobacteria bacterium MedPE]|nr:MAG: RND transporter [Gammaproteobacteria bacterium MedPE]
MDIVRDSKKSKRKPLLIAGAVGVLVVGVIALMIKPSNASYVVDKDALLFATVEQGDMKVRVRGTGVLASKDIRWLATDVAGRVERIVTKAGAIVKKGDVILELSNPQLVQQMQDFGWQLEEMQAETTALEVSLESQLLDQETVVLNEQLNYERAKLTFDAENSLLTQGVIAISKIKHQEAQIEVKRFKQRWDLEKKRLAKRRENLDAQRLSYQAKLKRLRHSLERAQKQVDNLTVRASMDSIVQEMPLELGQQVNPGNNLARLARSGLFIAELRIPEKLIKNVKISQAVSVDTRSSIIKGHIIRIDPAVVNGTVQVDVDLLGELPIEARPDLTIDGVIDIADIENTLFVKRPMYAKNDTQGSVYVLDEQSQEVVKRDIEYGQTSNQFIEIKSGLKSGESIVVSDVTAWQSHQKVSIN